MIICDNGICREMTEEEIVVFMAQAETEAEIEQEPTMLERIEAIESAILEEVLLDG